MNFENKKSDSDWLKGLVRDRFLDSSNFNKSEKLVGLHPSSKEWALAINYYLLSLGSSLFIVGVVFFFAYNWKDLHKFLKLGIIQFLFLIFVSFSVWKGLENTIGKVFLFLASVCIGIYFAVLGQVYQTGADSYELFLLWTCLVTVFAFLGKDENLLFFWVLLINITMVLFWNERALSLGGKSTIQLVELLFILNVISFCFWEYTFFNHKFLIRKRWQSIVFALVSVACISIAVLIYLMGEHDILGKSLYFYYKVVPWSYILFLLIFLYYVIFIVYDLFLTAASFLSLIIITISVIIRFFKLDSKDFLVLSLLVIVEGTVFVMLLKKISLIPKSRRSS
ncbi:MAG: DUF2157 domain-containing protein [Leptospiraceae bacterium]|nr:DUF2157 domain-containing protein [Leptospiraceae bacterium]MCK6380217.1 DUF2157 domain-containing protein [Leptospiraceae bacterium]NUM41325.1 DUF2157 domain-containing protein [Leptospiraceae bacterium]